MGTRKVSVLNCKKRNKQKLEQFSYANYKNSVKEL